MSNGDGGGVRVAGEHGGKKMEKSNVEGKDRREERGEEEPKRRQSNAK